MGRESLKESKSWLVFVILLETFEIESKNYGFVLFSVCIFVCLYCSSECLVNDRCWEVVNLCESEFFFQCLLKPHCLVKKVKYIEPFYY